MKKINYFYRWIIIGFVLAILIESVNGFMGNLFGVGIIIYLLCVLVANSFKIREEIKK